MPRCDGAATSPTYPLTVDSVLHLYTSKTSYTMSAISCMVTSVGEQLKRLNTSSTSGLAVFMYCRNHLVLPIP